VFVFKIISYCVACFLGIPLSFVNIPSLDLVPFQIVHFSILESCS